MSLRRLKEHSSEAGVGKERQIEMLCTYHQLCECRPEALCVYRGANEYPVNIN